MTSPETPFGFGFGPGRFAHRSDCDRGEFRGRAFRGPGFGKGFGPGFGPGFGFGEHPRGRGRGRGRRGDVRAAVLALLAERPMHGYEMIQEIAERSNNIWRPSPGSVYPTLQLLVDEGLITETDEGGSRKQFTLTSEGRDAAEQIDTPPWDKINEHADPSVMNLHSSARQLMIAIAQASQTLSSPQQQRVIDIVNAARKQVYGILGEAD